MAYSGDEFVDVQIGGITRKARLRDIFTDLSSLVTATVALNAQTGRLTTQTGVYVSTADRTAQSTIYLTGPGGANFEVALFDGTSTWTLYRSAQISLALAGLTSGKNYDVFVYGATPALELSAAWTDDTTRADALASQNGVLVKASATTRRYVGTIRTTGTTTTEDSLAKRFVWNRDNRVLRPMSVVEATDSWTYTTTTFRQANAAAANQLAYVCGLSLDAVTAQATAFAQSDNAAMLIGVGVGVDSTTVNSARTFGGATAAANAANSGYAFYQGFPGIGYHFLAWLEKSGTASGTTTWYGDAGGTVLQSGVAGEVWG